MSHDFEPTDAEKEMLSYMKDIEVNQKQTELGEIISGAILDGQNQIHDLYKEKATSQQIEYRMRRAYVYWMDRLNKTNDHQLQKARQDWLREEIVRLEGMKTSGLLLAQSLHNSMKGAIVNETIQTIIDRYHSELDQDKK